MTRMCYGFALAIVAFVVAGVPDLRADEAAAGTGVTSLNGLKGKLTIAAGVGTSVTKVGTKTLTITGLTFPYLGSASTGTTPVMSVSNSGAGGLIFSNTGGDAAITGDSNGNGIGVYGECDAGQAIMGRNLGAGNAGKFWGSVDVTGTLSKGGGSFKIDHPLDPENMYLYHSFVESPDMMNIYNGNAVLDEQGEATVEMPAWFEALNSDFRYQLTAIGAPGPNLHVAEKITASRFRIAGGAPGMEVSWQITGIRRDPFADANRIPVEEMKPEQERGYYLYPHAYSLSRERGVEWATFGAAPTSTFGSADGSRRAQRSVQGPLGIERAESRE